MSKTSVDKDFLDEVNETFEVDPDMANVQYMIPLDTKFSAPTKNVIKHLNLRNKQRYIAKTKFFVMSTNVLCKVAQEFIPIEISLVEYSINDGITRSYHRFVHPNQLPFGYRAQAIRHSEKTHQLPVDEWLMESTDDFESILKEIVEFLGFDFSKTTSYSHLQPFIVCRQEQMRQNRRVLKYICDQVAKSTGRDENDLTSFSRRIALVDIIDFNIIALKSINRLLLHNVVEREFEMTKFDYDMDTNCEYHKSLQCNACSLGVAQRMCKLLNEYLVSDFGKETK